VKTQHTKLLDVAKSVLGGKFIAIMPTQRKKNQISNLTLHFKEQAKEENLSPMLAGKKK